MSPNQDLTGATIACYRIRSRIGSGGMGEVYLARDEKLGRDVAIKFLPPHLAVDRDLLDRFLREAQAASALNHPNVLIVHDLRSDGGHPFIVTEYIEGQTLRERLKSGAMPVPELLDIAVQIASALAAAHERAILHRDIKPENVMIRTDGYVKLLDFGLATAPPTAPGQQNAQTRTGVLMGTPAYMSPEQARALPLDFRSDQFSFGATLYELATGRSPFWRASFVETVAAVVNEEPESLDRLCPQAPAPLRWTIERCLAKKPLDRYGSTRDLEHDLSLIRQRLAGARPAALALGVSNLPTVRAVLLGRDEDTTAVVELLARADVRWVTLTGPGGVGKTRLAIHAASAAAQNGGAAYFVPLSSVQDFSLVPSVIAETLEIRPRTDEAPLDAIMRHFRASKPDLILVIDNFEHVADAAPLVTGLLECSAGVRVLATSRASLHVSAEHEYQVAPLALPKRRQGRAVTPADAPAIALFVERARAVRPDFQLTPENIDAVVDICVALDGLPLAIELAAARVKALPPQALLARLGGHRLSLAGGARDLPRRQQALRATIEWSYQLLTPAEQRLFRRLAVFAGGWTIEAAEAVANPGEDLQVDVFDGIESLVDKSLVRPVDARGEDVRFTMLETIREYGLDRLLDAGDSAVTRRAHAAYALVLAEEGASAGDAVSQMHWLRQCDAEHTNLRVALDYLLEASETEWAMRLATALMPFWQARAYLPEARERFDRVLGLPGTSSTPELWARFGVARATILYTTGDYAGSSLIHRADVLPVFRELSDRRGVAVSLNAIGVCERARHDYPTAKSSFEEALSIWRELGDHQASARTLSNLAAVAFNEGDHARATALYRECRAASERIGDAAGAAWAANFEAQVAGHDGDQVGARALYSEALAAFRRIHDAWGVGDTLLAMGHMACAEDSNEADRLFREAHAVFAASRDTRGLVRVIEAFVCLAVTRGDPALALRLAGAAAATRQAIAIPAPQFERDTLARALETVQRQSGVQDAGAWMEGWAMTPEEALNLVII